MLSAQHRDLIPRRHPVPDHYLPIFAACSSPIRGSERLTSSVNRLNTHCTRSLELSQRNRPFHLFDERRALHRVFVASLLGLPDVRADVFYRSPIPPVHIERIEEVHDLDAAN